ncbi:MAG TPA: hypothetical protein VF313_07410 [Anaerolineaceae bacterium]
MSVTRAQQVEVAAHLYPGLVELSCGDGSLKVGIEVIARNQSFMIRE